MKRLLSLTALIALTTGCFIGNTDTPVRITSVREIQPDPEGESCADDLRYPVGLEFSPSDFSAFTATQDVSLTFFLINDAVGLPVELGANDVAGTGHLDFYGERTVLEYDSPFGLASESVGSVALATAGNDESCTIAPVLGPQAIQTLRGIVVTEPALINVRVHLEGHFTNGAQTRTNDYPFPVTIIPD